MKSSQEFRSANQPFLKTTKLGSIDKINFKKAVYFFIEIVQLQHSINEKKPNVDSS